ncbi:related to protein PER1 [Zygosaccharomyces bailii]|nr:related to protein PER1 [Zygosaccharomyces bailii]
MRLQLLALGALLGTTLASPGDQLGEFAECKEACEHYRLCPNSEIDMLSKDNRFQGTIFSSTPTLLKHFLVWDCVSDCDYQCQQIVTHMRMQQGEPFLQFHGKWPFKRLLGMQEFFSTIFSIGNFIPHYRGYRKLQELLRKAQRGGNKAQIVLLQNYIYVTIAGMIAWSASTVFHLRDRPFTEKMDYFWAGGTVISAFHAISIRVTRLDKRPQLARIFSIAIGIIFALHVLRLAIQWSYAYNMRFNVAFGILQYILVFVLSYQNYRSLQQIKKNRNLSHKVFVRRVYALCVQPLLLVLITSLAMSLELFDFFSYTYQIDAHAIWHLATIWPSWVLYDFLLADFNHVTRGSLD